MNVRHKNLGGAKNMKDTINFIVLINDKIEFKAKSVNRNRGLITL